MEEINKITQYLKDKLSLFNSSLINFPSRLEVRKSILKLLDYKEKYLIIVDSQTKKNYWNSLIINNNSVTIVLIEEIVNYYYTKNSLIIDVYPGTYDKFLYQSINNIYYNTCWYLFENTIPLALENVRDRIQGSVKIIDIKEDSISKLYDADNTIYLLDRHLEETRETELYKYYTGIPFKKEHASYNEFIPAFQQNAEIELCISPKDKYQLLAGRYFFYKKKRTVTKNEFIKFKTKESYLLVKDFLEEKRWDIISDIITNNENRFFIYKPKMTEKFENFAIKNGITIANNKNSVESYRFDLRNVLASEEIENISDVTDYVILGSLLPTTTTNLKELSYKFSCPIIVPYYRDTRDITIINKIKETFKFEIISSIERFKKDRISK